jgi:cell division protein FtsA
VEQVFAEIKAYGHEDPRRKLIAGIVLTGGGANLKHIKQLVEYITGMDTRIGYPNEHLAGNSDEEFSSPLYATAVGLVMNSIENKTQSAVKFETTTVPEKVTFKQERVFEPFNIPNVTEAAFEKVEEKTIEVKEDAQEIVSKNKSTETMMRRSFFDKYVDKIKEFLDNAE